MIESGSTLAIHPGALGDVLLAIPALRALRAQRPGAPLVIAAQPRLGRLLAALGAVDRSVDFESLGLGQLFTASSAPAGSPVLREAGRVVCWFGSRDARFVANLRAAAPEALVDSPSASDVPVWQHLRRSVGAPLDGDRRPLVVPPAIVALGRAALRDAGWDGAEPVALLHPGAGSARKRWPVEGFAAVAREACRSRRLALIVHEGPADGDAAAALVAALGATAIPLREPSLEALAGALATAALYLGNDSGVSHLAAVIGAPGVVLYTPGLLGWRPWTPEMGVLAVATGELIETEVQAVTDLARAAMA
jgi:ADP-heptose:LPS heptosyltransferase